MKESELLCALRRLRNCWQQNRFPAAPLICERLVYLPLHPDLTDEEAGRMIEAVAGWSRAT